MQQVQVLLLRTFEEYFANMNGQQYKTKISKLIDRFTIYAGFQDDWAYKTISKFSS